MELEDLPRCEAEEFDSEAEIEAVFRSQRRLSLTYGAIFLGITLTIPVLVLVSPYWTSTPVLAGFSPSFLAVALFYHFLYVLIGAGYSLQANRLEEELLGQSRSQRGLPPRDDR